MNKFWQLFCLFIIMIFLSACGNNQSDSVIVQFASWGSKSEIEILRPILAEFERENPNIRVEFMHIPQNYFQKIHLLFASNKAPDVIFLNNYYLPIYANAGLLRKFEDTEFDSSDYYLKSLAALSWKGDLYALPRDISTLVIFYNKKLFKARGVPYPKSGWSIAEFLETAKSLTSSPNIFGISFDEDSLFYLPYLMSNGGGVLSEDLVNIFESENSKKSLEFYADLRHKYHVAPLKHESASATMAQMFIQGRLGMHLSGRWLVPKYREELNFDWDVVEFPEGKWGSIVPLDASGWAIAKSSENPDAALKLVRYLSSKKVIEKFTDSGLIVPARISVSESSRFLNSQKPCNAKVFLDVIKSSKPTPVSVDYREILDELKLKTETIF